jgi:nicotinamide mononucleotide transporter
VNIFGEYISWVEITGSALGIIGVWLVVKKSIWNFPIVILSVSLQAISYLQSKLYADLSLQIIYIVILSYGWVEWSSMKVKVAFEAEITSAKLWLLLTFIFIFSTGVIGTLFGGYTDASLPYFDSMLMSASLIAQWMIARKKIENWLIWIPADMLYVGMYIYKGHYLYAVLYFIFIPLAVAGYREWKKVLVRV